MRKLETFGDLVKSFEDKSGEEQLAIIDELRMLAVALEGAQKLDDWKKVDQFLDAWEAINEGLATRFTTGLLLEKLPQMFFQFSLRDLTVDQEAEPAAEKQVKIERYTAAIPMWLEQKVVLHFDQDNQQYLETYRMSDWAIGSDKGLFIGNIIIYLEKAGRLTVYTGDKVGKPGTTLQLLLIDDIPQVLAELARRGRLTMPKLKKQ